MVDCDCVEQEEFQRGNHVCDRVLSQASAGPTDWGQLVEAADSAFFSQHKNYLQVH